VVPAGKIPPETFDRVIAPRLGARRRDVLTGPAPGLDAGVIDLGAGQVMVAATDPFFVMPELGWRRAGWLAVHIVASDAATSGLPPAYMAIDLNLPPDMREEDLDSLWSAVDTACKELGIAIFTGHTGRYDGCSFPMLGGATAISIGWRRNYVTPAMARPGDVLVITKGAAIETTGMLGALFAARLEKELGPETARAASELFWRMTVVRDAALAAEVGVREDGVTSMHDATERGIWGGLLEIAEAAGVGVIVERDDIILRPEVRAVCDLLEIDPHAASSEGTLLITCRPHRSAALIERLRRAGIAATACGELHSGSGVGVSAEGRTWNLEPPIVDPFWPALQRALDEWGRP
jgi:hydrogenase maturation factor